MLPPILTNKPWVDSSWVDIIFDMVFTALHAAIIQYQRGLENNMAQWHEQLVWKLNSRTCQASLFFPNPSACCFFWGEEGMLITPKKRTREPCALTPPKVPKDPWQYTNMMANLKQNVTMSDSTYYVRLLPLRCPKWQHWWSQRFPPLHQLEVQQILTPPLMMRLGFTMVPYQFWCDSRITIFVIHQIYDSHLQQ